MIENERKKRKREREREGEREREAALRDAIRRKRRPSIETGGFHGALPGEEGRRDSVGESHGQNLHCASRCRWNKMGRDSWTRGAARLCNLGIRPTDFLARGVGWGRRGNIRRMTVFFEKNLSDGHFNF